MRSAAIVDAVCDTSVRQSRTVAPSEPKETHLMSWLNQVSPCARNHPMVALMPCSHCSHPPLLPPFYIDSILAALCQLLSCTTLYAGDASLSLQRYWCCSSRMLLSMAEMRRSHSALKDTLNTARLNTSESGTAP